MRTCWPGFWLTLCKLTLAIFPFHKQSRRGRKIRLNQHSAGTGSRHYRKGYSEIAQEIVGINRSLILPYLYDGLPMAVECRLVSYNPRSCRLVGEKVASAFKDGTKLK